MIQQFNLIQRQRIIPFHIPDGHGVDGGKDSDNGDNDAGWKKPRRSEDGGYQEDHIDYLYRLDKWKTRNKEGEKKQRQLLSIID